MRVYYDCEFHEDGITIDLISIGMVRDDGAEYYAVSSEFDYNRALKHPWLAENVLPHLPSQWHGRTFLDVHPDVKTRDQIRQEVFEFCNLPGLQLWAYFSAYDHVALSQLFGTMMDLPKGWPQRTRDLAQRIDEFEAWGFMPAQTGTAHNALEDARHVKASYDFLTALES